MQPTMNTAITTDAMGRLSAMPPWFNGLSRKSPTVAPSGRVRMNAAQNNATREMFVRVVEGRDDDQGNRKHQRAAFVAEAGRVGHAVPERRSQGLGERDGGPVKCFEVLAGTPSRLRSNLRQDTRAQAFPRAKPGGARSLPCNRCQANGRRNRPWWCRTWWRRRSSPSIETGGSASRESARPPE